MIDRRNFLASVAGATAAFSWPGRMMGQTSGSQSVVEAQGIQFIPGRRSAPAMPDASLPEERYWAEVRRQFEIPMDEIYLNNGTCGSSPYPVLKAVFDCYNQQEQMDDANPDQYPLFGYGAFDQYRGPVAKFINCAKDEIAIVRNATEANAIMANGLDMNAGDEVLMSDQEHPSGLGPWQMRAKRYGIVVKQFEVPKPAKSPGEILERVNAAITPRTKVIFVSHITTTTGVVLPVKEICALARSKGIVSMVDGAQVAGMMPIDVRAIGCDLYGSSPHKWLMAPKGSGFLFVRDAMIDRIWSNTTTAGWDDKKSRAARFQQYGSSNVPIVAGMVAAIDFTNQIGAERIERRQRELADYLLQQMVARGAESWTSPDAEMRRAIVTVNVAPAKMPEMEKWMWKRHRIRIRGDAPSKVRLSTPYYLQRAEIDRFLEGFDEYRKTVARG